MNASKLVNRYLTSFYTGAFDTARDLIAPDFHFKGPFVEATSRDAFFASAARLAPIVRGHRLLRQWEDGDDVCSVYELSLETPAGAGSVGMSEWHTVRGNLLVAGRCLFDGAAFRALVPAR